MKIRRFIFDVINGFHSEIPYCCTFYFSWLRMTDKECDEEGTAFTLFRRRNGKYMTIRDFNEKSDNARYVRCNNCFEAGRIVDINHSNGVIFKKLIFDDNPTKKPIRPKLNTKIINTYEI